MNNPHLDCSPKVAGVLRTKIFQAEAHWQFADGWLYNIRPDGDFLRVVITTPDNLREEKLISSSPDEGGDQIFDYTTVRLNILPLQ